MPTFEKPSVADLRHAADFPRPAAGGNIWRVRRPLIVFGEPSCRWNVASPQYFMQTWWATRAS
jgi:hypothetical protein